MSASGASESGRAWWRQGAIGGAIVLAVLLAVFFGLRLHGEMDSVRRAPRDNVQWTLSQLEVDTLALTDAILAAQLGTVDLGRVRGTFDNLYSRVVILTEGSSFAMVRASPGFSDAVRTVKATLDAQVPAIDGADPDLRAALPALLDDTRTLRTLARGIAIEGIRIFADASDARRAAFYDLLETVSLVALALFLVLAVAAMLMIRSERISAQRARALERSSAQLSATIDNALDPIVVIDGGGQVLEFNEAAARVFGHPRAAALGARLGDLIVPQASRAAHEAGLARFGAGGAAKIIGKGRFELTAMRADGSEFPVELSIAAAVAESGPIYIGYLRDISLRVETERALTVARDQALAADLAKSEFIAVISHEMRTPLNGVLGVLDLLKDTRLDDEQAHFVDTAIASGEILLRHINDVLDITRIEIGKIGLRETVVDIRALLAEVVRVNHPVATAQGNRLDLRAGAGLRPVLTDDQRVLQVAIDLVGNAVKFCRDGVITLEADLAAAPPEILATDTATDTGADTGAARAPGAEVRRELRLSVTDTGIGIGEADQARIFDDFVTVDSSYQRRSNGSGLGLAICRRIVAAMGGRMGVESKLGIGSRFWVTLPVKLGPQQSALADEATAARVGAGGADGGGAGERRGAPIGAAIGEPEQSEGDAYPGAQPGLRPGPPDGSPGEAQGARQPGAAAGPAHGPAPGPIGDPEAGNGAVTPLDVLIVEDNETNRLVVHRMLRRDGHRITEAFDGLEGVRVAASRRFDLILMDISMPGINGMEATRRIRGGGRPSRDTVIIGLTAHATPAEQERFQAAGMQDCVTKPIRARQLRSAVAAVAESLAAPAREPAHSPEPDAGEPLVDPEVMAEIAEALGVEALVETCGRIEREIDAAMPQITAAASAGDLEAVERRVHALAGVAGLMGVVRLRLVLGRIEVACKDGAAAEAAALVGSALPGLADDTRAELARCLSQVAKDFAC